MTNRFDISPGALSALVVDDEPRIREYLQEVIEEEGWKCVSVGSGDWAVEEVQRTLYDVVFLDLVMPGINGPEVLIGIRAAAPSTKVIIVTGYPDSALMMDARRFQPDGLLIKPFGREELCAVLKGVADARAGANSKVNHEGEGPL
jgi:two-component system NtrC family sensor kinase